MQHSPQAGDRAQAAHARPRPDPAVSRGPRLLALATSGAWTSVAVVHAGVGGLESHCTAEPAGVDQSARLLAMVGEALGSEPLASVGAVAFDAGPGAFTGLRVGCSVAQGLGFASGLPLVPVGSLEAAAWRSMRRAGVERAVVLVANDARMGELYTAVCAVSGPASPGSGPAVELLAGPRLARPDAPPTELSREAIEAAFPAWRNVRWLLAGDAWKAAGLDRSWQALAGEQGGVLPEPAGALPADAQSVGEVGFALWQAGFAVDAALAAPRYVRDKVAYDVDEQRQLRAARSHGGGGGAR